MYTQATAENMVVKTALAVSYTWDTVSMSYGSIYHVVRHATKEYRFIDLTEFGAVAVVAAKVNQYTRTTRNAPIAAIEHPETYPTCTSSIQAEKNDCGSWDVVIQVNETDSVASVSIPDNPATLFVAENARNYDENLA